MLITTYQTLLLLLISHIYHQIWWHSCDKLDISAQLWILILLQSPPRPINLFASTKTNTFGTHWSLMSNLWFSATIHYPTIWHMQPANTIFCWLSQTFDWDYSSNYRAFSLHFIKSYLFPISELLNYLEFLSKKKDDVSWTQSLTNSWSCFALRFVSAEQHRHIILFTKSTENMSNDLYIYLVHPSSMNLNTITKTFMKSLSERTASWRELLFHVYTLSIASWSSVCLLPKNYEILSVMSIFSTRCRVF